MLCAIQTSKQFEEYLAGLLELSWDVSKVSNHVQENHRDARAPTNTSVSSGEINKASKHAQYFPCDSKASKHAVG